MKALVDGKSDDNRESAYFNLNQGLHADGVVGPSAVATIALLADVLASHKEGAHRAAWLIGNALSADHERRFADPDAPMAGPIDAVKAAVTACKKVLLEAVRDVDARVRSGVAFALAWAPHLGSDARAALRNQLAVETDDRAKLSQLLALGILTYGLSPLPEELRDLGEFASGSFSPLVTGGSALAALLVDPKTALSNAEVDPIVALLEITLDREATPWCGGVPDRIVVAVGRRAGISDTLAVAIASRLDPRSSPDTWARPTNALLELAGFAKTWQEWEVALPEELSSAQLAVAKSVARRNGIQRIGWGMPRSGRDRRRWLGVAPPGPLEKRVHFEIDGQKTQWPVWKVWRVLHERGPSEPLPGPIAALLDPPETLEALVEVEAGAYHIRVAAGEKDPPPELLAKVAIEAGPKGAQWANWYADEVLALNEARSAPELGGSFGMPGAIGVFLAILESRETIETRWNQFVPFVPTELARRVLDKVPASQSEACIWERMSLPHVASPTDGWLIPIIVPLLDLVPSKRITKFLLVGLANGGATLGMEGRGEPYLAQIRALAQKEPGVAEALADAHA